VDRGGSREIVFRYTELWRYRSDRWAGFHIPDGHIDIEPHQDCELAHRAAREMQAGPAAAENDTGCTVPLSRLIQTMR
jgi:hypothetical protein